jgi:hypothetical protein
MFDLHVDNSSRCKSEVELGVSFQMHVSASGILPIVRVMAKFHGMSLLELHTESTNQMKFQAKGIPLSTQQNLFITLSMDDKVLGGRDLGLCRFSHFTLSKVNYYRVTM